MPDNRFSVELHPHNQRAYDRLVEMLQEVDRACVIEPPGCGKSFIAYRLIADNPDKRFLWLGPNEYVFAEQRANFEREGASLPDNLTTMTYSAALAQSRRGTLSVKADFVILDEFHHCGAPEWGRGVDAVIEQCPDAKLVGLSATEIRYGDNDRDMSCELFRGNVAMRMSFEEAWIRGILAFPKYVCALYDAKREFDNVLMRVDEVRDSRKRSVLMQRYEKLRRSVEQAWGIDGIFRKHLTKQDAKVVVFCPSVEKMKEFYQLRSDWFKQVNEDIHAYQTYSDYPYGDRDYEAFKHDDSSALKLLYCVNQLNEGVHISGINAVVMVRPTESPVVYKQQLGRALDIGNSNEPIVFDLVNNVASAGSIVDYRRAMEEIYEDLRRGGEDDLLDPKDFVIIDEVRDPRFIMKEMVEATNPKLVSIAELFPNLIEEWDYERNGDKSPYTTSYKSTENVWWKCRKGHDSYEESPIHRTRDTWVRKGCPACALEKRAADKDKSEKMRAKRQKLEAKSLSGRYPEIAVLWDGRANGMGANAFQISEDNILNVYRWRCDVDGLHAWSATIAWQLEQVTCPYCDTTVKPGVNDLSTKDPDRALQWDSARNGDVLPKDVSAFSLDAYWWCCDGGHSWKSTIRGRSNCPICSRGAEGYVSDPLDQMGNGADQFYDEEANGISASCVSASSGKYQKWRCPACNATWQKAPKYMVERPYCPYCAGEKVRRGENDLKTRFPLLASEWKCKDVGPDEVVFDADRHADWRCMSCGEEWTSNLRERVRACELAGRIVGCPSCNGDASKARAVKSGLTEFKRSGRKARQAAPEKLSGTIYVPEWASVGARVRHAGRGVGSIVELENDRIRVRFVDGGLAWFDMRDVVAKGTLVFAGEAQAAVRCQSSAKGKADRRNRRTPKPKHERAWARSGATVSDSIDEETLKKLEELKRSME